MNTSPSTRARMWSRIQMLMTDKWGAESQNRLAREAGVGVATIARLKMLETSVGLDVVEKVAHALGVQAWQLLCPVELLEGAGELSPLAQDLGRELDQIRDPDLHRRAFAVASQVISFGASPSGIAAPASGKQPSPAPLPQK